MNKKIQISLIFGLIILLGCSAKPSETRPAAVEQDINELPDMVVTLLDSSRVDVKKLSGGTILIFFQPECDHCQRAARAISQNLAALAEKEIYFITSQSLEMSGKFAKEYKLDGNSNVHFSWASMEQVLNNFGPIAAPSVYIYSADHKLIKSFNGDVKIEDLLKYI